MKVITIIFQSIIFKYFIFFLTILANIHCQGEDVALDINQQVLNINQQNGINEVLELVDSVPVGSIPATFNISSSGRPRYEIPLFVLPGRRGIQPNLSLVYNGSQYNGRMGVGWTIRGFSMITRCKSNFVQDGILRAVKYDEKDKFCLDGKKLITINGDYGKNGTEYRTEKETFVKVISHGDGPDRFEVWARDKKIYTYDRVEEPSEINVTAWALTEVKDRYGNYMTISYDKFFEPNRIDSDQKEVVEFHPKNILYTGNKNNELPASREIIFNYVKRDDPYYGFSSGKGKRQTYLLSDIFINVRDNPGVVESSTLVRKYELRYIADPGTGKNLLETITECDGKDICKPTTVFSWKQSEKGLDSYEHKTLKYAPDVVHKTKPHIFYSTALPAVADVNGDGFDDLIYIKDNTWRILQNVHFIEHDTKIKAHPCPIEGQDKRLSLKEYEIDCRTNRRQISAVPLDYNYDGRQDLFIYNNQYDYLKVLVSTGNSFTVHSLPIKVEDVARRINTFTFTWEHSTEHLQKNVHFVDINGDKVKDLVYCKDDRWRYRIRIGDYFKSEVVVKSNIVKKPFKTSYKLLGCFYKDNQNVLFLDGDGDGAKEMFFGEKGSNYNVVEFREEKEKRHVESVWNKTSGLPYPDYEHVTQKLIDINGDGHKDVLMHLEEKDADDGHIRLWINTGKGFIGGKDGLDFNVIPSLPVVKHQTFANSLVADYDGDGRQDLWIPLITDENCLLKEKKSKDCPDDKDIGHWTVFHSAGEMTITLPSGSKYHLPLFEKDDLFIPVRIAKANVRGNHIILYGYQRPRIMDVNGDFMPDFVYVKDDRFVVHYNKSTLNHMITTIRDGMIGAPRDSELWENTRTYKIEYKPPFDYSLSYQNIYSKGLPKIYENEMSSCVYPVYCIPPRQMLVSNYYKDQGEGVTPNLVEYRYFDSRYDLRRGTWLGFGAIEAYRHNTNATTITRYNNYTQIYNNHSEIFYPRVGVVFEGQTTVDDKNRNRKYVTAVQNKHRTEYLNGNKTYYPFLYQHRSITYDIPRHARDVTVRVDRVHIPDGVKAYLISSKDIVKDTDKLGNITMTDVTIGDTTYTKSTAYDNYTDDWAIGLKKSTKETSTVNGKTQHRYTEYKYYDKTHVLKDIIKEPKKGEDLYLKTTLKYDVYGNLKNREITGKGKSIKPRIYRITEYDDDYIFPKVVYNEKNHKTEYNFDPHVAKLKAELDPNGLITLYTYDRFGRFYQTITPDNVKTTRTLGTVQDAVGYSHLTSTTVTDGETKEGIIYDRLKRPIKKTTSNFDGTENYVKIKYNHLGKVESATLPAKVGEKTKGKSRYVYDNLGRLRQYHRGDGFFNYHVYSGRKRITTSPNFRESYIVTNLLGQITESVDIKKKSEIKKGFDGFVHPKHKLKLDYKHMPFAALHMFNAKTNTTEIISDAYGRVKHLDDPNASVTKKRYDSLIIPAEEIKTTYKYWPFGALHKIIDAKGNTTKIISDAYGRVKHLDDPDTGITERRYNALDEIIWEKDANQDDTAFYHDELGRLITKINEKDGISTWIYDKSGIVNGETTKGIGKLYESTSPWGHSERYLYDNLSRLKEIKTIIAEEPFIRNFEYDAFGRLSVLHYPVGSTQKPFSIKHHYTNHGFLKKITEYNSPNQNKMLWQKLKANDFGQTTEEVYGNFVFTKREYDPLSGHLTHIASSSLFHPRKDRLDNLAIATRAMTTSVDFMLDEEFLKKMLKSLLIKNPLIVQDVVYLYDQGGDNLAYRNDLLNATWQSFGHDKLGRLTSTQTCKGKWENIWDPETRPMGNCLGTHSFAYNDIGNLTYKSNVGSYKYHPQKPHAVVKAGINDYGYDAIGNQIKRPKETIVYTSLNKIKQITKEDPHSSNDLIKKKLFFEYDADGNRVLKRSNDSQIEKTIYVGELFEKVGHRHRYHIKVGNDPVAVVERVRFGSGEIVEETSYLHDDNLGSISVVTNEKGEVIDTLKYDAFGQRRNEHWMGNPSKVSINAIRFGFTGHQHDQDLKNLDLINMRGREYDPVLGRFLTADPFVNSPYYGQNLNRYSYVLNKPLKYIDPSGFSEEALEGSSTKIVEEFFDSDGIYNLTIAPINGSNYVDEINSVCRPDEFPYAGDPSGGGILGFSPEILNRDFSGNNPGRIEPGSVQHSEWISRLTYSDKALSPSLQIDDIASLVFLPYGLAMGGVKFLAKEIVEEGVEKIKKRVVKKAAEKLATRGGGKYLNVGPGAATNGSLFRGTWIKRDLFRDLQNQVGKADFNKFKAALNKGVVGPRGQSGIKILKEAASGYTHELKIGGSAQRLLGKVDKHGILIFDKFVRGGLH